MQPRWFCEFSLKENTPDHSIFCQTRKKIGINMLSKIFADLKRRARGLMNEVFHFVDATHLITKANL